MIRNFDNSDKFTNATFSTSYSFASARGVVRTLSDAFSRQHCDTDGAIKHAAKATKGRCLYCGVPLYSLLNDKPTFSNLVNYDHIYPASKMNLFAVGNVALSCETCNLAKSDRLPMDYYDIRSAEGSPLLIHDKKEFEEFFSKMTQPYRERWPEHFEMGTKDLSDEELKSETLRLLYNEVDMARANARYNHENSVNWPTWKSVVNKGHETYTPATVKDVEGRIGYANDIFENLFGHDVLIQDCTILELNKFVEVLLLSKYDSKNEVQKYRLLIKLLIEVLNDDLMQGQLESFYDNVPTYSQLENN